MNETNSETLAVFVVGFSDGSMTLSVRHSMVGVPTFSVLRRYRIGTPVEDVTEEAIRLLSGWAALGQLGLAEAEAHLPHP